MKMSDWLVRYLNNVTYMYTMTPFRSLLLVLLGFVLTVAAVDVQAQTRASISGEVLDEEGEPLPGANVVAVHEPSGTQYGASTGANGQYNLQGLRVGGPYTVTASFIGYQSTQERDLTLSLNERREVNFQLQLESDELEEVRVLGERITSAVIDRSRTGARTNVSEEEIERLPSINRSLSDFARLTPQFSGDEEDSSIGGTNERYNTIQIDGATLNDVFGLGASGGVPGGQAGTQPVSLDAIQEFNVDIAPYDVRQSGFTGGRINAITKSGTNQFEGSFRYLGRNQNLIGDLDGQGFAEEFNEQYFIGTLGGPIIEDELFFFVSGELFRRGSPSETVAGVDSEATNIFPVDPLILDNPNFDLDNYDPSDLTGSIEDFDVRPGIRQVALGQYGYEPGTIEPFTRRQDNNKLLVKLDWNALENHNVSLRHNYINGFNDSGIGRGFTSFDFSSQGYAFDSVQNSTALEINSRFGNRSFNEFRFVYTRIRDSRDPDEGLFPDVTIRDVPTQIPGNRNVGLGVGNIEQANRLDQDLFEITSNFTYQRGDHTITIGTNNEIFSFNNLFIPGLLGSYEFEDFTAADGTQVSAIDAFRRGQPVSFQRRFANPSVWGDEQRPEADFTGMQFSLYAQDEWDVTSDLRLTLGVRADMPFLPEEPSENPDVEDAFGFNTSEVPRSQVLWSPRLGFNYTIDNNFLGGERETQFRGGAGIFSGRTPFVWLSNQYSNTGIDFIDLQAGFNPDSQDNPAFADEDGRYDPNASCFAGTGDPSQVPAVGDCDGLISPIETSEINLTDPDFKYPQSWRFNLAVDQELPYGFIATIEGLYSETINSISARNLNIEQTGESAYGRPFYNELDDDGNFPSGRRFVDERFTDVILLENGTEGYEYSLTGQIQRQVREGLSGSISYTYGRSQDVNSGAFDRAETLWRQNFVVDPNSPQRATSRFETRHRVLATLNQRFTIGNRYSTSIGVVYDARSGRPFTWIHSSGDANGDDFRFNDLPFVPANERDVVLQSENWDLLDGFIENEPGLSDYRGEFVPRNSGRQPWSHQLDLRLTQEVQTFQGQRIELTANLENVLNFLNDDWGRVRSAGPFSNIGAWDINGYVTEGMIGTEEGGRILTADDVGKPIIDFEGEPALQDKLRDQQFNTRDLFSRWQLQLGVRYVF